jgi:ketosteroid isomerase-like protein
VGVEGLQEWWNDVCGYYDDLRWDILEVEDVGEQTAVRWRFVGTSRGSGIPFDTEMSQLWSFRDGRVSRIEVFPDAEGARSAARP